MRKPDPIPEKSEEIRLQAPPAQGGAWLAWFTLAGTAAFTALTLLGLFVRGIREIVALVDMTLFLVGIAAFLIAIVLSGSRALRGVGVRASGLFLAGFASRDLQLIFRLCFAWTVVLGLGAALVVSGSADAGPYVLNIPTMAYGILVPIFPPALAGVHGARYCPWPTRR